MRVSWIIIAVLALTGPASAQAIPGGTNMAPDFYPRPKCEPAGKAPVQPGNDPDAMNVYNLRVRTFNQKVMAMNLCMKAYVDNAQNDINTIQKVVRDAVNEANAH